MRGNEETAIQGWSMNKIKIIGLRSNETSDKGLENNPTLVRFGIDGDV